MDIRGDRNGLTLMAHGFSDEEALVADLRRTLAARAHQLGRAALNLSVGSLPLSPEFLRAVGAVFADYPELSLSAIKRGTEPDHRPEPIMLHKSKPLPPPKVVRNTIRSGQREVHTGDLMIVGDVNPGATLVAGGDIMVFGRLRGVALAGQPGDNSKGVYALRFEPSQIRIGEVLAIGGSDGSHPECAHVEDGRIVVVPWEDVHLPEAVTTRSKTNRSQASLS